MADGFIEAIPFHQPRIRFMADMMSRILLFVNGRVRRFDSFEKAHLGGL